MRARRAVLSVIASLAVASTTLVGIATTAHATSDPGVVLPPWSGDAVPSRIEVFGDLVYATWAGDLYSTPADGTGSWTAVTDPVSHVAIHQPASYWDGVVVTQPGGQADPTCPTLHFATPTHAWSSPAGCLSGYSIGSMGRLVALSTTDSTTGVRTTSVYDAETGPTDGPDGGALVTTTDRVFLAGTWVWRLDGEQLLGHDTSGAEADRTVSIGPSCDVPRLLTVFGDPSLATARAWVECGTDSRLVDVSSGAGAPLVLPYDEGRALGDGFVYTRGALDPTSSSASVVDFSKNPQSHQYGPGIHFTASDTGAPRLAWADGPDIHVATMSWLSAPLQMDGDQTSPTIDSVVPPPHAIRPTDTLPASWNGSDDESAAPTYQLQLSDEGGAAGTWADVPGYGDATMDVADVAPGPAGTTCLRVRAFDRVGNTSAWRRVGCSVVDTQRPVVRDVRLSGGPVAVGPRRVSLRYRGVDDGTVTDYVVQRRAARAGHPLGDWSSPHAWTNLLRRHVSTWIGRRPTETCFRVRAEDAVGRVSRWSAPRCVTTPYDDSAFVLKGSARRARVDGAVGGHVVELPDRHAATWLTGGAGREVWILAAGVTRCPRVWWGAHQVMEHGCTVSPSAVGAAGYHWYRARTTHLRSGAIYVAPRAGDRTRVDTVAVIR